MKASRAKKYPPNQIDEVYQFTRTGKIFFYYESQVKSVEGITHNTINKLKKEGIIDFHTAMSKSDGGIRKMIVSKKSLCFAAIREAQNAKKKLVKQARKAFQKKS